MAPNLARIAAPTAGEAARLNPMKAPKAPALAPYKPPKNPGSGAGGAGSGSHSVYDQFTLKDPFNPANINGLAQTGFNADVANAKNLATMGQTPDAQIQADYAQRGQNENGIYQALQQQLAGIQTAQVAQGNAGSAALGTQNAGIGAAPGVLPTAGAQAVLGANTAATGNYGGSLQAAALSAGAQGNRRALDAATVAQTTNDQNAQKTLASLLSGIPTTSARESSMLGENQKVDAANIATKLSNYKDLVNRQQFDESMGYKAKSAADANALKRYTAGLSNTTKLEIGLASDKTKLATTADTNATRRATTATTQAGATARSKAAAAARVKAAKTAADAKVAAATTTAAGKSIGGSASGTTASGKPIRGYKVALTLPGTPLVAAIPGVSPGKAATKPRRTTKTFTAAQWKRFMSSGPAGRRQLKALGLPEKTIIDYKNGVTPY